MPLTSSSFSHSVNFCHIKSNGLYPPFPQRPPRGADAAKDLCGRLTEQAGEQGNEDDADERHAAARHELFHALTFSAGVVVSVAFQQVNGSPNAETGTEGDDEGLENADSRVEKFHICVAGIIGCWLC